MIKNLELLGLKSNQKSAVKNILKTCLYSYLFIFIVIIIKSFIFKLDINDIITLAKKMSLSNTIFYGIFCFFQELIIRGIIQRYFVKKTNNKFMSFIIANILFAVCHVGYSIKVKLGALVIGFICSFVTDKDGNIYRSVFIHWILGGFGYIFIL